MKPEIADVVAKAVLLDIVQPLDDVRLLRATSILIVGHGVSLFALPRVTLSLSSLKQRACGCGGLLRKRPPNVRSVGRHLGLLGGR